MLLNNGRKWLVLFVLCFALGVPAMSFAVSANPGVSELEQPDGNIVMVVIGGNEWSNWVETVGGYTIDRGSDGYWYYVTGYDAANRPVLSAIQANEEPAGLSKHVSPLRDGKITHNESRQWALAAAPQGTLNGKVLFILVQFTDISGTYTESDFSSVLVNNLKDYYYKASNGKVTLSPANESFGTANNGVVGWLTLNYDHPNTGGNTGDSNRQLARDAIVAADPYVDYASYDTNHDGYVDASELAVVVIAAGYERSYSATYTPSVWGHQWSLGWGSVSSPTADGVYVGDYHSGTGGYVQFGEVHQGSASNKHKATVGIMAHELGHLIFDLPDLYDTDKSSKGLGYFCLMASGSWGMASADTYSGATPVLPGAWVRSTLGWIDAYIAPGNIALAAIGDSSATASNTVYKATTSIANEYFLVENRQPQGYDKGLERWLGNSFGGLAIFHIDDNVADNDEDTHRKVDLVEADGTEDSYGGESTDLWYAGNATTFNDTSSPNSKLYNGSSSGVSISSISAKGIAMTASTSGGNDNNTVFSHVERDFDGDGKGDILWHNTKTGDVVIWLMNGSSISQSSLVANMSLDWKLKGIGDFNGDGKSDTLWQNTTSGDVVMWLMNGVTISSAGVVVKGIPSYWTIKAVADFNGDGKADVLWQNTSDGDVAMWLMNGMAISSGNYVVKGIPSNWQIKAVGDFDGDGRADVLWQETASGDVAMWLLNGMTIVSGNYVVRGIPTNWQIKAVGDFDGDGKTDVLWQETTSVDVAMWLLNGMTIGSGNYVVRGLSGNWQVLTTGDFNGDAKSDVVLQDNNNGDIYIWLMNGATITDGSFATRGLPLDWWTK
ncbi:MAG: M6 family metalloprotease domain-containing protein [Nitrospirae bacterium]|uniref:M6 family metalloprotease domain-containing protein n=1 Tax=Candidatus Magnetobacterium casense TaxID=1455061 RepID=UPI000695AC43|nr:M6 family metalloprotease domain-containing protein [Candidatus Magnetobacterium casensis]MBF0338397.1 M6 family metalloprotease domain-containing protein [Nitrospirota bacterium]